MYSSLSYLSVTLTVALVVVLPRLFPALRVIASDAARGRSGEIDGLRGLLSLLIVLHHAVIMKFYVADGIYQAPPGNWDNLAGAGSVALFFVGSAYLLWGKVLAQGGQLEWVGFYRSRVRRLAPMYGAALILLVVVVLVETGFRLDGDPMAHFIKPILQWSLFGFLPMADINGRADTYYIQVVLWTLKLEWQFYLILPLLMLCVRGVWAWVLYGVALVVIIPLADDHIYGYFVVGAVCAHLRRFDRPLGLGPLVWAGLGVAGLAAMLAFYRDVYGLAQMGLFGLMFMGVTSGAGPWALLRLAPLRYLGVISYSTYLLHHMILHVIAHWVVGPQAFAALSPPAFSLILLAVEVIAVTGASCAYLWVERPWIGAKSTSAVKTSPGSLVQETNPAR